MAYDKSQLLLANLSHPLRLVRLLWLKRLRAKMPDVMPCTPMTVDVEPNVTCNLACRMCQTIDWQRHAPDLRLPEFREIVDQAPTLMRMQLQGMGEPLLARDFFGMVEYAGSRGILVSTTTNGMLMDRQTCQRIVDSPLASILISVDGATARTYEAIRVRGNSDVLVENIRALVAARGRSRRPRIGVWMVGMRRNVHELPAMVRLCRDWGVDDLTFQYHLAFWGKEPWKESLADEALREEEPTERCVNEATRLAKDIGLRFLCWRGDKYSVKARRPCPWPWRSFYVTADRFVCPCCVACDPRIVSFANLSEVTIRQVWNSPKYQRFRAAIRTGNIPTFCRGCYTDYTGVTELTD